MDYRPFYRRPSFVSANLLPCVRVPFLVLTPASNIVHYAAPCVVHYAGCYPASLPLMAVLTRKKDPLK